MPQVRKPEVDASIRAAALQRFATDGYPGTSMASIARTAGIATANIYRYYPDGKQQLFDTVLPQEIVDRHADLVERRVQALLESDGVAFPEPQTSREAQQLLAFWVAHRLEVAILLGQDHGTPHAGSSQAFVDRLVKLSESGLVDDGAQLDAVHHHILRVLFDNTRRALVEILLTFDKEESIRRAVAAFWSYQLPGLEGFRQAALAAPS